MGIGDELLVTGELVRAQQRDPRPVTVLDKHGNPRWHNIWTGNKRLLAGGILFKGDRSKSQTITNGPSCRPYIDYEAMKAWARDNDRAWDVKDRSIPWRWVADYRAMPGEIVLSLGDERWAAQHAPAHPFVVIEPHTKRSATPNKDWGWSRWQALVKTRGDIAWMQLGPAGTQTLDGVQLIETPDFRLACSILKHAIVFVGTDGALHHAAAALGVPAIVIWGGYTHPRNLGYEDHVNLHAGGEPCGSRQPCEHCDKAMAQIAPGMVLDAVERALARQAA